MRSGEKHYTSKYWLLEKHQSMMGHFNQSQAPSQIKALLLVHLRSQ